MTEERKAQIILKLEYNFADYVQDMLGDISNYDILIEDEEWDEEDIEFIQSLSCTNVTFEEYED